MSDRLRVALVGGPMYDTLYEPFIDDVEVVVHADHPTLNRRVAELLAAGERIDVLSTHGKYAPSQARWLRPLDGLLDDDIAALAPRAVDLCRYEGALVCAPRNIDVRVLWWRADRMPEAPRTWADLAASSTVFGFTGRESGLFGLFFELVVGYGGALFDADARPTMTGPEAEAAIALLCELAARAPRDLPDWHYDQVDAALLDDRVDCAAAWPGGYGAIRASSLRDLLRPAPYMGGPAARVSYSGVHAWAIPTTCGHLDGAVALVSRLCSVEFHDREAAAGGIPARVDVLQSADPDDDRLRITRETIEHHMITYPHLVRFPEVEDAGWGAIHDALTGNITPAEAVHRIQTAAEDALGA